MYIIYTPPVIIYTHSAMNIYRISGNNNFKKLVLATVISHMELMLYEGIVTYT